MNPEFMPKLYGTEIGFPGITNARICARCSYVFVGQDLEERVPRCSNCGTVLCHHCFLKCQRYFGREDGFFDSSKKGGTSMLDGPVVECWVCTANPGMKMYSTETLLSEALSRLGLKDRDQLELIMKLENYYDYNFEKHTEHMRLSAKNKHAAEHLKWLEGNTMAIEILRSKANTK